MPDYRIEYERMGGEGSTPLTEEFEAKNDKAAQKIFDERKQRATEANATGRYYCTDHYNGLYRIDQREKTTKIC